jgi:hypothetical protein
MDGGRKRGRERKRQDEERGSDGKMSFLFLHPEVDR